MSIHKQTLSVLPSVRQLRAFVAVYHTGSISEAAHDLSLTQPAVTILLRELEGKLGIRLFDRSTRSIRRTDAAIRAIGYAQRALGEMEGLVTSMSELAGLHAGHVRVVATAAIAQFVLPPVMRRFLDGHPGISLQIDEVAPAEFVGAIENSQVDFGVGTLEAPVAGLHEDVLIRESLVAAALPSSKFPAGTPITWKQLSALPLVTVRSGYGIRGLIEATAHEVGVTLRIEHEVSLLSTAVALAGNGLGVVVAPPSIVAHDPSLVVRRLIRPTIERVIGVQSKLGRSTSPAAEAFLQVLKQVTKTA